ncbi:MAG TPA: hypothetical protein VF510_07450 [Ktedonobacterales bacterium]
MGVLEYRSLHTRVHDRYISDGVVRWGAFAAWFPAIEWQRTKVREATPEVTLDMRDLAAPEAALLRVYGTNPIPYPKEDPSAEAIQAVIDLFSSPSAG